MAGPESLRSHFADPVARLSDFLWWATSNVGLALLQVPLLLLVMWVANVSAQSERVLANCVLLFYSSSLMGTTIYSLRKNSPWLSGYGLALLLFVSVITSILYTWTAVVAHNVEALRKPAWDKQRFIEISVALLVTMFAFFADEPVERKS